MTMQHISAPASRVVSLAAHRRLTDRELGEAMGRDFDAAVIRAPIRPRERSRWRLSLTLAALLVALVLAFGLTAALAGHLVERTAVELLAAEHHKSM